MERRKSILLALVLTLFMPGAGHYYLGHVKKTVFLYLSMPVVIYTIYYFLLSKLNIYLVVFSLVSIAGVYIYAFIDVYRISKQQKYRDRSYNRWYFALMVTFMLHFVDKTLIYISPITFNEMMSPSMSFTVLPKDQLVTLQDAALERGSVVTFRYSHTVKDVAFISRIVAFPGDELYIENKNLYLHPVDGDTYIKEHYGADLIVKHDGKLWVKNPYITRYKTLWHDKDIESDLAKSFASKEKPFIVPANEYFMLNDNRDHAHDSRDRKSVKREDIIGVAKVVYLNTRHPSRIGQKIY